MRVLSFAVWVSLPDLAVGVLSDLSAIGEHDLLLAICKLGCFHSIFLNTLFRAIRENALFLTIRKIDRYCAIRENYFLGVIWEVFLDLVIRKFEYLQTIWKSCLGCPFLCKIIHNSLICIRLLNIVVIEVDYSVSVWEDFSFDTIVKDNLFLSIFVFALYLTIRRDNFFDDSHISLFFVVVVRKKLHIEVLALFFELVLEIIAMRHLAGAFFLTLSTDIILISDLIDFVIGNFRVRNALAR
jgi:hypothetical protein